MAPVLILGSQRKASNAECKALYAVYRLRMADFWQLSQATRA